MHTVRYRSRSYRDIFQTIYVPEQDPVRYSTGSSITTGCVDATDWMPASGCM